MGVIVELLGIVLLLATGLYLLVSLHRIKRPKESPTRDELVSLLSLEQQSNNRLKADYDQLKTQIETLEQQLYARNQEIAQLRDDARFSVRVPASELCINPGYAGDKEEIRRWLDKQLKVDPIYGFDDED